jgi:Raf kinase inhibitor-like YbhB/YbcL family protein
MERLACLLLAIVALGACAPAARNSSIGEASMAFALRSQAFQPGTTIPRQHTCDGADQSPALTWSDAPAETKSLALIVEDPDAPSGTFTHWVLFNVPPEPAQIPPGVSHQTILDNGARQGRNDFRRVGYGGPCPPRGPAHHYFFRLYALDAPLDVTPGATASEVRAAARGHTVGEAELMGVYGR